VACSSLAQLANHGRQIRCVLKKSYCGDAGGTGGATRTRIFWRNSPDGENWNREAAADCGESLDSLRRAVTGLGGRGEDRTEGNVVRAGIRRSPGRIERMGRSTNEEGCGQPSLACELFRVGYGNALLREMNAGSTNRASNVEPVVHQNAASSGRHANGFLDQVREFPAGQLFFPNLYPIHACVSRRLYFLQKKPARFRGRPGQSAFVRHIAQKKRITNWFGVGHSRAPIGG
jgi:hypothetical protein